MPPPHTFLYFCSCHTTNIYRLSADLKFLPLSLPFFLSIFPFTSINLQMINFWSLYFILQFTYVLIYLFHHLARFLFLISSKYWFDISKKIEVWYFFLQFFYTHILHRGKCDCSSPTDSSALSKLQCTKDNLFSFVKDASCETGKTPPNRSLSLGNKEKTD